MARYAAKKIIPFIRNLRSIFHRALFRLSWNTTAMGKKEEARGRDNKDDNVDDEEDNGWEGTDSGASDNGKIIIFANKVPSSRRAMSRRRHRRRLLRRLRLSASARAS